MRKLDYNTPPKDQALVKTAKALQTFEISSMWIYKIYFRKQFFLTSIYNELLQFLHQKISLKQMLSCCAQARNRKKYKAILWKTLSSSLSPWKPCVMKLFRP